MAHYAEQRREEFRLGDDLRDADLGAAADGRGGLERRRCQLGADRRRRRLREPAQRRGHRLRASRPAAWWPSLIAERRGPRPGLAGAAERALRRGVLDRPPPRRPGHRPAAAARPRPGGHALGLADDPGAALDGQPGDRRGPRPGGAGVALGRPALDRPRLPAAVLLMDEPAAGAAGWRRTPSSCATSRCCSAGSPRA